MTRYTLKNLQAHVSKLNEDLAQLNHKYRIVCEQISGITWISYATPQQIAESAPADHPHFWSGSPIECSQEASNYVRFVHVRGK